jgi:hypothetical protein
VKLKIIIVVVVVIFIIVNIIYKFLKNIIIIEKE